MQPWITLHPHCNLVWEKCYTANLDKIIKLKKRIMRIIENGYMEHTRPLFLKLKLLNLYDINELATGTFVYECRRNNPLSLPSIFSDYLTLKAKVNWTLTQMVFFCFLKNVNLWSLLNYLYCILFLKLSKKPRFLLDFLSVI